MKIKTSSTKFCFIFISILQILGSVAPVKQLIKLASPYGNVKEDHCTHLVNSWFKVCWKSKMFSII